MEFGITHDEVVLGGIVDVTSVELERDRPDHECEAQWSRVWKYGEPVVSLCGLLDGVTRTHIDAAPETPLVVSDDRVVQQNRGGSHVADDSCDFRQPVSGERWVARPWLKVVAHAPTLTPERTLMQIILRLWEI